MLPMVANAAIPYRVEQIDMPVEQTVSGADSQALARLRRFYVGGMYDFTLWNNGADDVTHVSGKTTSSFEVGAGVRAFDIFRIEANYIRTSAKWDAFNLTADTAMINAIFDARIGNLYRLFYHQRMVPYVGVGAGVSWNSWLWRPWPGCRWNWDNILRWISGTDTCICFRLNSVRYQILRPPDISSVWGRVCIFNII